MSKTVNGVDITLFILWKTLYCACCREIVAVGFYFLYKNYDGCVGV